MYLSFLLWDFLRSFWPALIVRTGRVVQRERAAIVVYFSIWAIQCIVKMLAARAIMKWKSEGKGLVAGVVLANCLWCWLRFRLSGGGKNNNKGAQNIKVYSRNGVSVSPEEGT